jgi:hypothetical protein
MFIVPFFPFGLMGTVRLNDVPSAQGHVQPMVHRIMDMLQDLQMKSVEAEGSEVHFTANVFQPGSNFHVLVQFGSGVIAVEPRDGELLVKYRLSSLKMLAAVGVMISGLGLFTVATGKPLDHELITSLAIGWAWLFTGNYIWGALRFPKWLREGLIEAEAAQAPAN